ncbi:hypothetical protein [Atlantibacter hermannii]|uniref:hypothetical protein n=1 Tax=Atlantibacter hermannii TaxID=565 RepID=UPI00289E3CBC|nr:hypothetical protein [Atlantibacter hermannii]
MKNDKYAIIENGIVINVVVWQWDGTEEEDIFKDYEKILVEDDVSVGVGFTYDGGEFSPPEPHSI